VAARPATLPAAVVPVLVGTAAAVSQGWFRPGAFVAALLASLCIQVGTNYSNDYFDHRHGADTAERLGPIRLIQRGVASPTAVLRAALAAFALAAALGLYLIYLGGWPILLIGALSILSGLAYTGGPYPLGYNGLGDVFVFVFFGLVAVTGTYYLHAGSVSSLAWWASVPVGLLVTNILLVNNVRDLETDRAVGKRTLAVRIGRPATRLQYALFLVAAYLVPPGLWLAGLLSGWFWLPWLTLPVALRAAQGVFRHTDGPTLNRTLKATGRLHLLYGVLFAASLLL
jgi:1,4-dihydroxy-2-naphthoate octaprenyltransferase